VKGIFSSIAAAWPNIKDILLGPVLITGIAVGGAIILSLTARIVAGIIKKSKAPKKIEDGQAYVQKRNRIVYAIRIIVQAVLWTVAGVVILTQVQRILGYTEEDKIIEFGKWLTSSGMRIVITIIAAGLLSWLVNYFSHKVVDLSARKKEHYEEEKAQRRQTILHSLRVVVNVIIWTLAGLMVLTELGVKVGAIIAGLGVVGIAVGFGAQNLIKDILGGFFIVLEDQMRLGDVVKVGGVTGTVEKMTLRITVIRSITGHYITVPNGEINIVENMTPDWSRAIVKVGVGYGSDIEKVVNALREAAEDLKADEDLGKFLLEEPMIKAIDNFGDSALDVALWIKCNPGQQWDIGRIARRYIKQRFDEAGIEIPFPQITLSPHPDLADMFEDTYARGKKEAAKAVPGKKKGK